MVKIHELKDSQLISQIQKYDRILKGLLLERKKRIASGKVPESLMTPLEKSVALKMQKSGIVNNLNLAQSEKPAVSNVKKSTITPIKAAEAEDSEQAQVAEFNLDDSEIVKVQDQNQMSNIEEEEDEAEEVRVTQLLQLSQEQIEQFKEKSKALKSKKKKKKKGLFG